MFDPLRAARAFTASARRSHDRFGAALAACMALYAIAAVSLAIWPQTSLFWMGRFHLRTASFALWAAAQPAPWMYNFENYTLVSDRPLTAAELAHPPAGLAWRAINHQSARVFSFAIGRAKHLQQAGDRYFYLRSRYRSFELQSGYRVCLSGPPSFAAPAAPVLAWDLP